MKKKFKIIFTSQNVGGFNAILPVIKELKKKKIPFKVLLANESQKIAKKEKIRYQNGSNLSDKDLTLLLEKESPDLLFSSTSIGKCLEKRIVKIAKIKRIPTVVLTDFWGNYKLCFDDPKTKKLDYLPDYFLIIDEIMKKEMIKAGFEAKKIFVTGNPSFDAFPPPKKYKENENLITFFSQPYSELFKGGKEYLGYNEIQVLKDLVEVFRRFQPRAIIKIKLHPRAKKINKFDKIIKTSNLNILVEKKISSENLIKNSKLIIGMNSAILFQAVMMGKTVVSYQPNLKGKDFLVTNRLGLSLPVYKKENLYSTLKKISSAKFSKKNLKIIKKYTRNNSTEKVINFIENES